MADDVADDDTPPPHLRDLAASATEGQSLVSSPLATLRMVRASSSELLHFSERNGSKKKKKKLFERNRSLQEQEAQRSNSARDSRWRKSITCSMSRHSVLVSSLLFSLLSVLGCVCWWSLSSL